MYRRIVVKLGTNLLTGGSSRLDAPLMSALVSQVARLHEQGSEVLLVSSGAVAAGREVLGELGVRIPSLDKTKISRLEVPYRQAMAAIGQGRLMREYQRMFAQANIPVAQALITHKDIADRLGYLNIRNTLQVLLAFRVIPILNENDVVAVEELEGDVIGDNDTLCGLVSNIVDADLLVMLGDVEGLYTADPYIDPEAELIREVHDIETVQANTLSDRDTLGTGGMEKKLSAAGLATVSGTPVVIASGHEVDVLIRITGGESIGTWFPARITKPESRQRWMLSATVSHAGLVIDQGATTALLEHNRSLLPAGIKMVIGEFDRGEVVPIFSPDHERLAVGISNYRAADVRRFVGLRSDQIGEVLGYEYGDEVVHRSNMVKV